LYFVQLRIAPQNPKTPLELINQTKAIWLATSSKKAFSSSNSPPRQLCSK